MADDAITTDAATLAVFVDSVRAWEAARRRGVPAGAAVRTLSPAMDAAGGDRRLDDRLTPDRIAALNAASVALSEDLYRDFADGPDGHDRHRGIAAARAVYTGFHMPLLFAAALEDADFEAPRAVVRLVSREPMLADYFGTPMADLMAAHPGATVFDVDIAELNVEEDPRPPVPGLAQRLRFAGPRGMAYRLAWKLGPAVGRIGPRGKVLIWRENELVKETALALAAQGYGLDRLPAIAETADADLPPLPDATVRAFARRFDARFGPLLAPRALDAARRVCGRHLANYVARYEAAIPAWRRALGGSAGRRVRAVLSNIASGPDAPALHKVLRERGIPLAMFQHGVTMEISRVHEGDHLARENSWADLAVVFDREAAAVCEANPYKQGPAVAAGLPADYRRGARRAEGTDWPPVWYVATALYLGGRGQLFEGVSDRHKAAFERTVVDDVLDRLPHRVLYKPYPGKRYLDPDPVLEAARAAGNIEVYEERIDLRYILPNARVLVTSRAFSTPSWCIMSGRPVVHIDIPDQTPLRPAAREAFEAGLFVFDAGAPDFHAALRDFLSKPLEEIEALYAAKAEPRAALIERFVDTGGPGAGRRAAAAIRALMRGERPTC